MSAGQDLFLPWLVILPLWTLCCPLLSELASSGNRTKITCTTTATPHQTTPDELILPPVLIPKLKSDSLISIYLSSASGQSTGIQRSTHTSEDKTTEPISLEMFNKAAPNLESKGVINLKKYTRYLNKKTSRPV